MKKTIKILLSLIAFMLFVHINTVSATSIVKDADKAINSSVKNITSQVDNNDLSDTYLNTENINKTSTDIFRTLMRIGIGLTVAMGGIIGIKFLIASAEDRAKIKETMIPYVIGSAVIFGAYGIWSLIVNVLNEMNLKF